MATSDNYSETLSLLGSSKHSNGDLHQSADNDSTSHGITRSSVQNLTVSLAAVFIIGKVTGVGILLLPNALSETGAIGIIVALLFLVGTTYSGVRISQSWSIVCERNDKYVKEISRNPYGDMAYEAYGSKGRLFTTISLYIYIFALCVTDLLVIAENTEIIASTFNFKMSLCIWLPIVTVAVCPMTWFGTPKDFWLVGVIGALTSVAASVLVLIGAVMDRGKYENVEITVDVWTSFAAFGLIAFSFAGQSVFPTLQHDMKDPSQFFKSVLYGYAGIALLYIPTSVFAVIAYHSAFITEDTENVASLITSTGISVAVTLSLNIHLIFAIVIFTNTLYQDLEKVLNIPYEFNWKRCVVRSTFMLLALAVGATIPSFQSFLSLFGGPLTALVNFLLPLGIYVKLRSQDSEGLNKLQIVLNLSVMALAVVAGTVSSISGIYNIATDNGTSIKPPCYVSWE